MGDKKHFREHCFKRLRVAQDIRRYSKDSKVLSELYHEIIVSKATSILLYLPLGMEVNLYPLIKQLRKEGKLLYVPYVIGSSFTMVKYRLPLYTKQFGIKEPKYSRQFRKKEIDLAIVPMVGVDATHRRVGFGKGMYDRFFEKEYTHIKKVIFVARALCYSSEIVTDHYDVRADMIITP